MGTIVSSGSDSGLLRSLKQLREIVANQEQAFFNSIPYNNIEELYDAIQKYNGQAINTELAKMQSELISFIKKIPKNDVNTLENFLDFVNTKLLSDSDGQQFLSQFNSKKIGPTYYAELAKIINSSKGNVKFKGTVGKEKQPDTRTGLFKLMAKLQLKAATNENGVLIIKPNVTIEKATIPGLVSKGFLKKIEEYCEKNGINLIGTKATELLQEQADFYAFNKFPFPYDLYYQQLKPSLILNASVSSIVGFIGELRAAFQFITIFGFDKISMVGQLTKLGSGQQIPTDMIFKKGCEMFGFQVKNYKISKNNTIKISNTLSAQGFVDGRLNLTGSIGELLKAFFGTYQFNQPFEEHGDPSKVAEYDKNIYSQFPKVFDSLKTLFDQRIGDILKIRDNFEVGGENNPFSNKQMYYNSFFIVGSKIVTSSSILDNMIISIEESIANQTVNTLTMYTMSGPKDSPTREHAHIDESQGIITRENFDNLASKISITYRITIQI